MRQLIGILFVGLIAMMGCEGGSKAAGTPNQVPFDCYAYGNCQFGFGGFGPNQYQNFNPYGIGYGQNPYTQNGFSGCGYGQYPTFYPNYGYVCISQSAFNTGANYGVWNYQPTSNEFLAASGFAFPTHYNYNNSFAFQGCTFGGNAACGCTPLIGVPSNFGVCSGAYGYGF